MNQIKQPELYDIFPEWHVPFWQTSWFFWAIVCISTLLLIALLFLGYQWYKARNKSEIPYWQQTLLLIENLQQKKYSSPQQSKQCYFVLTAALKSYLNKRLGYPIANATDEQAAQYMDTTDLEPELKKHIQEILRGCVLIKFANQQALDEQVQEHIQLTKSVITATIPKAESQTAA